MQLIPGGSLIFSFDLQAATGSPVSFDASPAPVLTFQHNGVADTGWTTYTMTDATAGNYDVFTTIPSGYVLDDYIACMVDGYIGGVEVRIRVFTARLTNTADAATLKSSQTFSTTGAVGSVTGAVAIVPPATMATLANQTTILAQTTATAIATAVWNAALAGYKVAGSFGAWLQSLTNSAGSGPNVVTIPVTNGSTALENVQVSVTDQNGTKTGPVLTNSSGNAIFDLATGTYTPAALLAGWAVSAAPAAQAVTTSQTLTTIVMSQNAVPTPAGPGECVTSFNMTIGGKAADAVTLKFVLVSAPPGRGNLMVSDFSSGTTDSTGLGYVTVYQGARYNILYNGVVIGTYLCPATSTDTLPNTIVL